MWCTCLKKLTLIGILVLTAACRRPDRSGNHQDTMSIGPDVALKDLKAGDFVHDTLTKQQLENVKRIHSAFSEVMHSTLAETIDKFKRDQHPDREIAIWLKMATAYERFAVQKHIEEYDKKKEAYELLLLRSMASEEHVLRKYRFHYLSVEEVNEVLSYYAEPPLP